MGQTVQILNLLVTVGYGVRIELIIGKCERIKFQVPIYMYKI
jgi:hypothetical protein